MLSGTGRFSKRPADAELKNRPRVELLVGERPIDRQLDFGLNVEALARQDPDAGSCIQPVPTADEDGRPTKNVLLAVEPSDPSEHGDPMGPDRSRSASVDLERRASPEAIPILGQWRTGRHAGKVGPR